MNVQISKEAVTHQTVLFSLLKEFDRVCEQLNIPYILFAGTMLGAVRHQGFIPWDDDLDVLMQRDDYNRFLQHAEEYLNLEEFFLQKEFSAHWPMYFSKLRKNHTTCLEKYHPKDLETHQGIYIDIFPCDNASNSPFWRKVQFFASKVIISQSLYKRGYETDSKLKKIALSVCRFLPQKLFLKIVRKENKKTKYVHSFLAGGKSFEKNVFSREDIEQKIHVMFEGALFPIPRNYDLILTQLYGDYMTIPPEEDRKCKEHALLVDLNRSYEEYAHYRDGMTFDVYTRSIR